MIDTIGMTYWEWETIQSGCLSVASEGKERKALSARSRL